MYRWIDERRIDRATGFNEDREVGLAQPAQQFSGLWLCQRFPSRDFDQCAIIGSYLIEDLVDRLVSAPEEGIVSIAPGATEWAAGQAYKHAGQTGKGRLALDAVKDLSDAHV